MATNSSLGNCQLVDDGDGVGLGTVKFDKCSIELYMGVRFGNPGELEVVSLMRRTWGLSVMYGLVSIWQGMLLHPYVTVRRVVRMKGWRFSVWLPLISLLITWLVGMGGIRLWLLLRGEGREMAFVIKEGMMFGWWWWVWFCVWWQGLVGYLALRFLVITNDLRKRND